MASICLTLSSPSSLDSKKLFSISSTSSSSASPFPLSSSVSFSRCFFPFFAPVRTRLTVNYNKRKQSQVVRMAPDEEKLTRRNPLDFPIEWDRPRPGRRPDIFPQFSPMKTPLPPPLPFDPPEEDDEEDEEKKEEEEESEEEEPEKPEEPKEL